MPSLGFAYRKEPVMLRRFGIVLLVFAAPGLGRAQDAPEDLLPAGAQVYLRWDGVEAHRAAYEKSALGKMLQGDPGRFVDGVFRQLQESPGPLLTTQQLLGGVPPDRLQKLQADAREAAQLLTLLGQHGLVFAAEVRSLEPPSAQVTVIVP